MTVHRGIDWTALFIGFKMSNNVFGLIGNSFFSSDIKNDINRFNSLENLVAQNTSRVIRSIDS